MITEWQPIMPEDKLKLKSRTLYELLREDGSVLIVVGLGADKETGVAENIVAWREFDCRPYPLNCEPPKPAKIK